MIFFSFLESQKLLPFHLKEALYSFSLAYSNCQHHYSFALGPLNKIKVARAPALWYWTVALITETATMRACSAWRCWTKGWLMSLVGLSGDGMRFHHNTQMMCNSKLMNCLLLKFSTARKVKPWQEGTTVPWRALRFRTASWQHQRFLPPWSFLRYLTGFSWVMNENN